MSSLRREVGSLAALFAFEAAGRRGSFTAAAKELGVSQAAVSKHIAALEADLDHLLFERLHREVRLTEEGAELFKIATSALSTIGSALSRLRAQADAQPVTVVATQTFSHTWLIPRLPSFTRAHPDLAIRVLAQDDELNLRSGTADLVIRYGDGSWRDGRVTFLFGGLVYAVASPGFLASRDKLASIEDVLQCPLIAYDTSHPSWVSWSDWLREAGAQRGLPTPALFFSRYIDALRAAHADQGVVLVWSCMTGGVEERNELVRVPGPAIDPGGKFYLVQAHDAKRARTSAPFCDWLAREADSQRRELSAVVAPTGPRPSPSRDLR